MRLIKIKNSLTVILSDGTTILNNNCTEELYEQVLSCENDEDRTKSLLLPEFFKKKDEYEDKERMLKYISETSQILTVRGQSVYMEDVSEISLPELLVTEIVKAEKEDNQELLNSYINFWTLCSLNPDSRVRNNLFWFLQKYGMTISKSGLFVAYRNVQLKKDGNNISEKLAKKISKFYLKIKYTWKKKTSNYFLYKDSEGKYNVTKEANKKGVIGNLKELYNNLSNEEHAPIYTDAHTRTFTIKIGEPVVMDRDKCDPIQENTCSRGLHVAGKDWLTRNYFGDKSLIVLVNPADVVAVPPQDSYGKMRTCAYYPVALVERDEQGNIIDTGIPNGFEDDFINMITYTGEINNEDLIPYRLNIPNIPEINSNTIYDRLNDISLSLKSKVYAD